MTMQTAPNDAVVDLGGIEPADASMPSRCLPFKLQAHSWRYRASLPALDVANVVFC